MDVFVSYANADHDRVQVLVAALEQEGFSVWWDQRLEAGTTYDDEIEQELRAARAVLTIWTETSKARRWVRAEADLADQLGTLIPIQFDRDAIPLAFRLVSAENFIGWEGDRDANCWKRLVDQLRALGGGREKEAPETITPEQAGQGFGAVTPILGLFSLLAAGLLLVPTLFGISLKELPGLVPFSAGLAIALFFLVLFMQADRRLKPQTMVLVSRWFLPVEGKAQVTVAEAFYSLFEAVFGRRHLSWRCLWRSALASTLAFAVILIIAVAPTGSYYTSLLIGGSPTLADLWPGASGIYLLIGGLIFVVITNAAGDYISLFETRILLRLLRKQPELLMPVVLVDAILTVLIFVIMLVISILVLELMALLAFEPEEPVSHLLTRTMQGGISAISTYVTGLAGNRHGEGILIASFLTTFITSVWLWLVLLLTPLSRSLVRAREHVSALGRLLGAADHPVAALGAMIAVLTVLGGGFLAILEYLPVLGPGLTPT